MLNPFTVTVISEERKKVGLTNQAAVTQLRKKTVEEKIKHLKVRSRFLQVGHIQKINI